MKILRTYEYEIFLSSYDMYTQKCMKNMNCYVGPLERESIVSRKTNKMSVVE